MKNQICKHFEGNNLYFPSQYGFRAERSTSNAVQDLVQKIVEGFESGKYVGAVFCDLRKAFDCVSHSTLTDKLKCYNFNEISLLLMSSYLSNRRQYVGVGSNKSEVQTLINGVPQGSSLGPILFLLYINDINIVGSDLNIYLFADDTTIAIKDDCMDDLLVRMQGAQSEAEKWFAANMLCLNNNKTKQMIFTHRDITGFENQESFKFLGINLDQKLTWERHCEVVSKKISSNVFVLRNLKSLVTCDILLMAFHALIMTHCAYGLIVWGHSAHIDRVFAMQRRAVRVVGGVGYRADVRETFIQLKILTIPSLYIYHCLCYMHKNLDNYSSHNSVHEHNTRRAYDLRVPYSRLQHSRNAINYYGPIFYNKLNRNLRNLGFNKFKESIKQFLVKCAFYSVQEYLELDADVVTHFFAHGE